MIKCYFFVLLHENVKKLETLQEIALFLDAPLYIIQEAKQNLSELVDAQARLVFFFGKSEQNVLNKQGEKVLDKMVAALATKQTQSPKITDIPITLIEISEAIKLEWDFEKLSVEKIIFFGENTASKVGIKHTLYDFFSIQNVTCLISETLEEIEAEQSRKMRLWNSLLEMFVK